MKLLVLALSFAAAQALLQDPFYHPETHECRNNFHPEQCLMECLFGWHHDEDGCPVCECANPDEETLYEGDIKLDLVTKEAITANVHGESRGMFSNYGARWNGYKSGNTYLVPISYGTSSSKVKAAVNKAAEWFKDNTCIRIVNRTNQKDYLWITQNGGCWSYIGRSGGWQELSLASGCESGGTAIHEIMHALGFYHEQSRPDRDQHIQILWDNIYGDMKYNFNKESSINSRGSPYETKSVMQYYSYGFSSNGKPTMLTASGGNIAWNHFPTREDYKEINLLYGC